MNPIAFNLFGLEVHWYGILIGLAAAIVFFYTYYFLKNEKGFNENKFLGLYIVILVAGIIGARFYYVIFSLGDYHSFWDVINIRNGGLGFYGGVIFGVIAIFLYRKYVYKFKVLNYLDAFGPALLLAQGMGRWGNFFNGEAHGGIVSKEFISKFPVFIQNGMYIDGVYYQPTFLYESISDFAWFIILTFLLIKKKKFGLKNGTIAALVLIGNGISRFAIEGLRTDSLYLGMFRVSQLVAIAFIIVGLIILSKIYFYDNIKSNKNQIK